VTLGLEGALLVDDTGAAWRIGPPPERGTFAVGSGDSMLAGFAAAIARGAGLAEAARLGPPSQPRTPSSRGRARSTSPMRSGSCRSSRWRACSPARSPVTRPRAQPGRDPAQPGRDRRSDRDPGPCPRSGIEPARRPSDPELDGMLAWWALRASALASGRPQADSAPSASVPTARRSDFGRPAGVIRVRNAHPVSIPRSQPDGTERVGRPQLGGSAGDATALRRHQICPALPGIPAVAECSGEEQCVSGPLRAGASALRPAHGQPCRAGVPPAEPGGTPSADRALSSASSVISPRRTGSGPPPPRSPRPFAAAHPRPARPPGPAARASGGARGRPSWPAPPRTPVRPRRSRTGGSGGPPHQPTLPTAGRSGRGNRLSVPRSPHAMKTVSSPAIVPITSGQRARSSAAAIACAEPGRVTAPRNARVADLYRQVVKDPAQPLLARGIVERV